MPQTTQVKTIKTGNLYRTHALVRAEIDEESRTVPLAFSSEDPYERWFGFEILDHNKKSIRLNRLKNGAPLLVNHWRDDHVGTIEDVTIGTDKIGRAVVRFGKSTRAEEIFQDVLDGIRTKVSVGYRVYKMILEEQSEDGPSTYRVVDWEPLEISIVSIAADDTVGVGKSDQNQDNQRNYETLIVIENKEDVMPGENTPTPESQKTYSAEQVAAIEAGLQKTMEPQITAAAEKAATAIITAQRETNETRQKEIEALAEKHSLVELGREHVYRGTSVEDFTGILLEKVANATPVDTPAEIGLGEKELKQYSLIRAINAASKNDWSKAGFEQECSEAVGANLKKDAQGFYVPYDIMVESRDLTGAFAMQRTLNVGTATAGGNLVATNLLTGSFIDMLRNRMMIYQLGATTLSGLVGDIAIPKQTGGATGYWLSEDADATPSDQTFGQVPLTPKTVAGLTQLTRKLLQQTSLDMENFVRLDLATVLALAIDLAAGFGTGANNQPLGVANQSGVGLVALGTNGGAPTYASMVNLETEVSVDNADIGSMAYLTNSRVRGKMKQTPYETGYPRYIWEKGDKPGFGEVNGYPAAVSNQVPSDLDKGTAVGVCSAAIFGVWSQLLIGLWGGLDILVDPYTKSASGGMQVTAFQDCDVNVRHPEAFAIAKDLLTT